MAAAQRGHGCDQQLEIQRLDEMFLEAGSQGLRSIFHSRIGRQRPRIRVVIHNSMLNKRFSTPC